MRRETIIEHSDIVMKFGVQILNRTCNEYVIETNTKVQIHNNN